MPWKFNPFTGNFDYYEASGLTLAEGAYIKSAVIDTICSGLVSVDGGGPAIAPNINGTTINIAAGTGNSNDHTGTGYTKVTWTAKTAVAMAGDGTNYVGINASGSAVVSLTHPLETGSPTSDVFLGHVYVSGGDVVEVFPVPQWSGHFLGRVSDWMEEGFGALIAEGLTVTEQATPNELKLNVATGSFYARLSKFTFTNPITTFNKIYNTADNGWVVDSGSANYVNTNQWNNITQNQASALVTMTDGFWKKDLLLITPGGSVYLVYAQAEYATEDAAKTGILPTYPEQISDDTVILTTIVSQKGDTTIANRFLDISPRMERVFGQGVVSGGTVVDHGGLVGLGDDDHTQYLNTSRHSTASHPIAVISGNTSGTTGTINTLATFAGGNNITISQNGNAITFIGPTPGAGGGWAIQGSGAYTQNTGTIQFANSNGITFGLSTNQLTASHNGLTTAALSNHSHGNPTLALTNISGTTASASNGLTLSLSANPAGGADGYNIIAAGGSTAATTGTVVFSNSNGISFGLNGATVTASYTVPAGGGDAIKGIAAGGSTATTNTVNFSNSNGISFGFGAAANSTVLTASHNALTTARASTDAIGLNTAATSVTWTVNSSGISLNAGAYLTTAANSTHSHGNPTLALTNINGTTASASNGLTLSLSAAAGGGVTPAISGSNGSFTFSTLTMGALNGLTFYTSNGSLVGSYTDAGGAGAAPTGNFYCNLGNGPATSNIVQLSSSHNSMIMFPLNVEGGMPFDITASTVYLRASISGSTATLATAHSTTIRIGVYTQSNNGSFVLLNSVQSAWNMPTVTHSSVSTFYNGRRAISIHSSQWSSQPVFKAGSNYYIALVIMSSSRACQTWAWEGQYFGISAAHSGTLGVNSTNNTWMGFIPGQGIYSSNTTGYSTGLPAQIANSQLSKNNTAGNFNPVVIINNVYNTF